MVLLILMRYKHDDVVCVWCKVGFDLHEKHAEIYGLSCMPNLHNVLGFRMKKTEFGVVLFA